jgi:hypothetical protein
MTRIKTCSKITVKENKVDQIQAHPIIQMMIKVIFINFPVKKNIIKINFLSIKISQKQMIKEMVII